MKTCELIIGHRYKLANFHSWEYVVCEISEELVSFDAIRVRDGYFYKGGGGSMSIHSGDNWIALQKPTMRSSI